MTRTWNDLEGVSLGRYWLKVCLTSSADDAWYLIRYDTTRYAAVRVQSAETPDADVQLDFWRRAIALEHPHIVRMFDAGREPAESDEVIFCVCEYPDDFLAAALRDRPLSPPEAREVLDATLAALGYLHEQNLAHGAVDSGHIMAFGETIKLPSDTIRPAGEEFPTSTDMWSLGVLVHEMLTREPPRPDAKTDFSYLPEPFRSIVRNTVKAEAGERWTVSDVQAHLNPPAAVVAEPVVAERVAAEPVAESVYEPARVVVTEPAAAAAAATVEPVRETPTPSLPPPHPRAEPPIERGFPLKWIPVAGLAAAAMLGAFVLRRPDPPAERVPERPPVTAPAPAPQAERKPPAAASVTVPPPAKQSRDRVATKDARPSTGASIWRVVAYTYNARSQAEKKAKTINEKNPSLHAQVFAPKGDRAPYYVSLGGRMTLSEAERVQKAARSKGLPKDTFVRNFSN